MTLAAGLGHHIGVLPRFVPDRLRLRHLQLHFADLAPRLDRHIGHLPIVGDHFVEFDIARGEAIDASLSV